MLFHKDLRGFHRSRARRTGFSLAELVVSIGVLVVLLGVAGQVMTLSVRSTGQARSLTQLNQQLRILEQTIREDLRHVDPRRTVMVIQCNPINAHWTQSGKDADADGIASNGYPHEADPQRSDRFEPANLGLPRADVLMFFTQRRGTSNNDPGVSTTLQQVVYGHANLGEYVPLPTGGFAFQPDPLSEFPTDPVTSFAIPAERWLLARRNVLLSPADPSDLVSMDQLGDPEFLRGERDVIRNFRFEKQVLELDAEDSTFPDGQWPLYWPEIFREGSVPFARSDLDATPPPAVTYGVNHVMFPGCASFKVEWALDPHSSFVGGRLEGESQVYWFDQDVLRDPMDLATPTDPFELLRETSDEAADLGEDKRANRLGFLVDGMLGGRGVDAYSLEDRFGLHDDSLWVDSDLMSKDRPKRPNLAVFTATRGMRRGGGLADESVPEEVFPVALRITVDVIDPAHRLSRPIRHVIVVPVGR